MSRAYSRGDIAAVVDHTLLKPEATQHDVAALVAEAAELGVYSVCVSPTMVAVATAYAPAGLHIAAVVGFPSGKHLSAIKAADFVPISLAPVRLATRAESIAWS